MKKFDWIIIISTIAIALIALGSNHYWSNAIKEKSNEIVAEISVKGALFKKIPLSEEGDTLVVETELGKNIIEFHDSGVSIHEANCFDHICIETGFISNPGEIIACLPHKVIIEIVGDREDEIDGLSK